MGDVILLFMYWWFGYYCVFVLGCFIFFSFGYFGFGGLGVWVDFIWNLLVGFILNNGFGIFFGDICMLYIINFVIRVVEKCYFYLDSEQIFGIGLFFFCD